MSADRKSIPTRYKSILFRSKLEADWARFFDNLEMEWQYEKEGRYFGDVFYLPDFWLPRSRQYVEVKAIWNPEDIRKLGAALNYADKRKHTGDEFWVPDIPIVSAGPDGHAWGYVRPKKPLDLANLGDLLLDHCRYLSLVRCTECRGWWFMDYTAGYKCQCCGAWDGDHYLGSWLQFPVPGWPTPRRTEVA